MWTENTNCSPNFDTVVYFMHGSRSGEQAPVVQNPPGTSQVLFTCIYLFVYLFIYLFIYLHYLMRVKHIFSNIKLFYHLALSNTRNIYT